MAAVPVEIRGTEYDLLNRTTRQVFIVGELARSDLSVGGGPIIPPGNGGGGGGGRPPHPEHPIPPIPAHPIVLPPNPPIDPPIDPPTSPPSDNWVWGWVPLGDGNGRWSPVYVPGPTDPQPHA